MRYAAGLSLVGGGALLIYSAFNNKSAWGILRDAIGGNSVSAADRNTGQSNGATP